MKERTQTSFDKLVSKQDKKIQKSPLDNSFLPTIKKELNFYGKISLFSIYGIICFGFGLLFWKKNAPTGEEIANAIRQQTSKHKYSNNNSMIQSLIVSNHDLSTKIRNDLRKTLIDQSDHIRAKDQVIIDLRNQIGDLKLMVETSRPKSEQKVGYSWKNLQVLRFEQTQQVSKLVKNQKRARGAFLSIHDMNNQNSQQKWDDFNSKQELDKYQLEAQHQEERNKFRKEKYRVISN
ncbi:MAG: hypothetical protein HOE90_09270 [Bacteriovoracaceae bacterium]|nr:hypothetical protein [Bacteriovoracaceae bacterium]